MAQHGDISLKLPGLQAVRVEYPGYIENLDAAIETLGGPQGLSRAAALGFKPLPLKFRPGDPLCRAIQGEKCAIKALLLKVPRSALKEGGPVTAKVVARVTSTYRFAALADFQFVADDSLPAFPPKQGGAKSTSTLEEIPGIAPQPLLTVPPTFARSEDAISYQFRSFYGTDHPSLRAQGSGKGKSQLPAYVLKFASLRIPVPLKETDFVETHYNPAKWKILTELRKVFVERPVWSNLALQERIESAKTAIDPELLAKVAYVFRSGPFLSLWIRRGYDPRTDEGSGKYQATVYTLPPDWAASLKHINNPRPDDLDAGAAIDQARAALPPVSQVYSELCRFAAVPRQSVILQLCDVQDLHVSTATSQTSQGRTTCDNHTGWYDPPVLEKMENRIQARFQALLAKYKRGDDATAADTQVGEGPSPMEVDAADAPEERRAPAAAASTSVPELDQRTAVDREEGIFSQAMLEGLNTAWPNPNSNSAAGGEGGSLPTATLESAEGMGAGGATNGQGPLETGDNAGEDFLIFEASSSGSEAEEQEAGGEEEEEEELDDDESDDDEEDEEEAESSEEEEDLY